MKCHMNCFFNDFKKTDVGAAAPSSKKRTLISTFTNILWLNFTAVGILDVTARNKLLFAKKPQTLNLLGAN